jgi:uncharacterized surface protein with fasciclin (FAS1) repeats
MTFHRLAALAACALALSAAPALAAKKTAPAPAPAPAPAAAPAAAPVPAPTADVIDTMAAKGNFKTFLKLLDTAGLTPTLKQLPSLTILAPDDAAFAVLAPGIVDGWLSPDKRDGLQRLMLYHVINQKFTVAQVAGQKVSVATPAGSSVLLDGSGQANDAKLHVNDAVVTDEIPATNGTIFELNKVLAPR